MQELCEYVKVIGNTISEIRRAAYAVLRHAPRMRLFVRKTYWDFQKQRYEKLKNQYTLDEKLIVFEAFSGRQFSDSPKAIYLELLQDERFKDYRFIWSFKSGVEADPFPLNNERTLCVTRGSKEYFQALSRAKIIILNTRLPEYVYPKEEQIFIQCWHGTPLKKLGRDVAIDTANALNTTSELAWRFSLDSEKWTYLLSASPYVSQHLADAFALPEARRAQVVLEIGDPGNDALVRAGEYSQARTRLRAAFNIPEGKKVVLYAPTWRDDSFQAGLGYTFDYLLDFKMLQDALQDEWVVLFRPHYYISNTFDFSAVKDFVINAAQVSDVNDCMLASDVLITDYSSVMFDYCNTGNPLLLFVPDLNHYENSIRDFYFDIHNVPGPLCVTTQDLIRELEQIKTYPGIYGAAYAKFKEQFCPYDDGLAASRVASALWEAVSA